MKGEANPRSPRSSANKRSAPVRARVKARRRSKGATRRAAPAPRQRRAPSVWLNRLMILVGAGVVVAAAVKAFLFVQSLPVQRITVTGELEHTQAEAVQEMVQASLAGGFLRVDLQAMREQLEGLPWIYEATVRRRWPNALEINVVEQLPIARWGDDGFLNHEGGVFHPSRGGDRDELPLLQGPEGSAQALMAKYQRLLEILAPLELSVEQLAEDERGQLEVVLAGDVRLVVGSKDFLERMHRFVLVYRNELAPLADVVERIDLRYETGMAVAFREVPQVAGLQQ